MGQFGASQKALSQIQLLFNDSNDQGIAAGLNEFFKAWQDVATNPADLTARTVLLTKADGLTKLLNQAATQLSAQRNFAGRPDSERHQRRQRPGEQDCRSQQPDQAD